MFENPTAKLEMKKLKLHYTQIALITITFLTLLPRMINDKEMLLLSHDTNLWLGLWDILKKITLTTSLSADKPSRMLVEQEGSLKTVRSSRFVYKLFSYSPNIWSSLSPETDLKCGVLLSWHKFEGSLSDRW